LQKWILAAWSGCLNSSTYIVLYGWNVISLVGVNTDTSETQVSCAKYWSLTVPEYNKHFLHLAHSSWMFLFITNWTHGYHFLIRLVDPTLWELILVHIHVLTSKCTVFILMKDWTMKICCWILYLFARVMNSDLRMKRSEQAELSHGAVLNTLSVTDIRYCTFCSWYVCVFVF
jgi:hypothetical protein